MASNSDKPFPVLVAVSPDGARSVFRDGSRLLVADHSSRSVTRDDAVDLSNRTLWGPPDPLAVPPGCYYEAHEAAACCRVAEEHPAGDGIAASAVVVRHMKYQIPKTVRRNAARGASWSSSDPSSSRLVAAGRVLGDDQTVDLPRVQHLHDCLTVTADRSIGSDGFDPGSPGYPSTARIVFECLGGSEALAWSSRIVDRAMTAAGVADDLEDVVWTEEDSADAPPPPEGHDAMAVPQNDGYEPVDGGTSPVFGQDLGVHPFIPSSENGLLCAQCGSGRFTLDHIAARTWPEDMDPPEEYGNLEPVAASVFSSLDLSDSFHILRDQSESGEADHWYEPDPLDGSIGRIFGRSSPGGPWMVWSAQEGMWAPAGQPPDECLPLDDASAFAAAVRLADGRIGGVGASEIDEQESVLADDARADWSEEPDGWASAPPVYSLAVDDDGPAVVASPWDGDPPHWRWDRESGDWQPVDDPGTRPLSRLEAETIVSDGVWEPGDPMLRMAMDHVSILCGHRGGALVSDAGYTPQERAQNASQQVRDASGRFSKMGSSVSYGGRRGTVAKIHPQTQSVTIRYEDGTEQQVPAKQVVPEKTTGYGELPDLEGREPGEQRIPKAKAPKDSQVLPPENINTAVSEYEKFVRAQRRKSGALAAITPETSDVQPIYFAIVDSADRTAVLELLALAPASTTGSKIMAYMRTEKGWEPKEEVLRQLRSTNPPPVVVIQPKDLPGVMEQIDSYYAQKKSDDDKREAQNKALGGSGLALWREDGLLLPMFWDIPHNTQNYYFGSVVNRFLRSLPHLELSTVPPATRTAVSTALRTLSPVDVVGVGQIVPVLADGEIPGLSPSALAAALRVAPPTLTPAGRRVEPIVIAARPADGASRDSSHVLGVGDEFHVEYLDTIPASAQVVDLAVIRDRPVGMHPGDDVGKTSFGSRSDTCVTIELVDLHGPTPARSEGGDRWDGLHPGVEVHLLNQGDSATSPYRFIDAHTLQSSLAAGGGLDRNRGGAARLRHYWSFGPGALKIKWGLPGDFTRCYRHLAKYMGVRAKGYCSLRHHEVLGFYPATHAKMLRGSAAPPETLVAARGLLLAVTPASVDEFKELPRPGRGDVVRAGDEFGAWYDGSFVRVQAMDPDSVVGWTGRSGDLTLSDTNLPVVRVDDDDLIEKDI